MKPVLYAKPSITELEIRYVADAIANGWGPRCNDYILRFEREFAKHLDVPLAMATASCCGRAWTPGSRAASAVTPPAA